MTRVSTTYVRWLAAVLLALAAASPCFAHAVLRVPEDFPAIQEAVDAAGAGAVIVVGPGAYEAPVVVEKGITIRGTDARTCIIRSTSDESSIMTLRNANGARLEGLRFERAVEGAPSRDTPAAIDVEKSHDVTISGCDFRDLGRGVATAQATVTLSSCTFRRCRVAGEFFSGSATVRDCMIAGFSAGPYDVALDGWDDATIDVQDCRIVNAAVGLRQRGRGTVKNTSFEHCGTGAMVVGRAVDRPTVFTDNDFTGCKRHGLFVVGPAEVRSNRFLANTYALGIKGGAESALSPEPIRDNVFERNEAGVVVENGARCTVESNKCISNRQIGIVVRGEGTEATISGNTCTGGRIGIAVEDDATVQLLGNTLARNEWGVIVQTATAAIKDNQCAENRYDGIMVSVRAGGEVVGNVSRRNRGNGLRLAGADEALRVSENQLVENFGWGVIVSEAAGRRFPGNQFTGNGFGDWPDDEVRRVARLIEDGKLEDAKTESAALPAPETRYILHRVAAAQTGEKRYADAARTLEPLAGDDDDSITLTMLAELSIRLEELDLAFKRANAAFTADPRNAEAILTRVRLLGAARRHADAVAALVDLLDVEPTGVAVLRNEAERGSTVAEIFLQPLLVELIRRRRHWDAVEVTSMIVKMDNEDTAMVNNLAYLLSEHTHRPRAALAFGEQILKLQPRNPEFLDTVAGIHLKLEQPDRAMELLRRGLESADDPRIRAMLLVKTVSAALALEDPEAAATAVADLRTLHAEAGTMSEERERVLKEMEEKVEAARP